MNKEDLLTELNTRIGDNENFSFTPEEKSSVLDECINDTDTIKAAGAFADTSCYSHSWIAWGV